MQSRPNDLTHEEIFRLVKRVNPIILEIGSHDGTDSLRFLQTFPECRLHCFECEPRAIAKWKARVGDKRATLHEVAMSDQIGTMEFHQSGGSPRPGVTDWDHSGSLAKPTGHLTHSPWCTFDKKITVPVTTLDVWEKTYNFGYVDFIWIDVQSMEGRVFSAAKQTLQKTRFVKAECHPRQMYEGQWTPEQMIAFFRGWTCLGRYADDLLFQNDGLAK